MKAKELKRQLERVRDDSDVDLLVKSTALGQPYAQLVTADDEGHRLLLMSEDGFEEQNP